MWTNFGTLTSRLAMLARTALEEYCHLPWTVSWWPASMLLRHEASCKGLKSVVVWELNNNDFVSMVITKSPNKFQNIFRRVPGGFLLNLTSIIIICTIVPEVYDNILWPISVKLQEICIWFKQLMEISRNDYAREATVRSRVGQRKSVIQLRISNGDWKLFQLYFKKKIFQIFSKSLALDAACLWYKHLPFTGR